MTIATGITGTTYVNTGLSNGTTYYYVVVASNSEGTSDDSNEVSGTPNSQPQPSAPTNLTATPGNAQVSLSWTASAGAATYSIHRGTTSGGPYTSVATGITATTYVNTGLTNGTTYYYVVTAVNSAGSSGNSNQASATPNVQPAPPTNLTAIPGNAQISLSWTASSGATSYSVRRAFFSGGIPSTIATGITATTYVNTGLTNGTAYYYVVVASNSVGTSGESNEVSATPTAPPIPPTNLVATPGNSQVALSWTASAGAATYSILRGTTFGGPYTSLATLISGTTFTDTSAVNGATYYYVATATNSSGTSGNSSQATATLKPNAPVNLIASLAPAQIELSWTGVFGASSYTVYRGTSPGGPYTSIQSGVTATTYVDATAQIALPYFYVVTANNAGGASPYSNEVATRLKLTATPGDSQVTLSLPSLPAGSTYTIFRAQDRAGYPYTPIATGVTTSYVDASVLNGSDYYYRVSITSSAGEVDCDTIASATPFVPVTGAVIGLKATGGNGAVNLTWIPFPGATSYSVYRNQVTPGSGDNYYVQPGFHWRYTLIASGVTQSSFTDLTTNGKDSYYVVTATTPAGTTGNSHEAWGVAAAGVPPKPAIWSNNGTQYAFAGLRISWPYTLGAESYSVYRSTTSGGPYVRVASNITLLRANNTDNFVYTDLRFIPGATYYYVITASNSYGESVYSNLVSVTAPDASLFSDGGGSVANDGIIGLVWPLASGSNTYSVQRSTSSSGTFSTIVSGLTSPYFIDTNVVSGPTSSGPYYYYKVIASGTGNPISANPYKAFSTRPPPTRPNGLVAKPGYKQVALRWNPVSGATGYYVLVGPNSGGPYRYVATTTSTSYIDTKPYDPSIPISAGIRDDVPLFYVVQALGASTTPGGTEKSGYSNEASTTPVSSGLYPPLALTATAGHAQVHLAWTASVNATSYAIFRSTTSNSGYMPIAWDLTGTTYLDTGLTNGVTYYYVAVAWDAHSSSRFSNEAYATPFPPGPPPPTGLVAVGADQKIVLTWAPSAGAITYSVYRGATTGGPYTLRASGITSLTYTDTPITNGTTYYYVVTAVNPDGESGRSNEAHATAGALAAPVLTATAGDTEVKLTWTAVTNAVSYTLSRSLVAGGPYTPLVTNFVPTTYTDTGLTNGTTYYYVVKAVNLAGESPLSNEASATPLPTPPPAPTGLQASAGHSVVHLSWNSSPRATSYTVHRAIQSGGPYTNLASNLTGTNYIDNAVTNGTTYFYVVTAANITGTSGYSNEAFATPQKLNVPIEIVKNPPLGFLPDPMTTIVWLGGTEAIDESSGSDGPSGTVAVNLAYGVAVFRSGADVAAGNVRGPGVAFHRMYRTAMAAGNLSSPGLPAGWTHSWDFWIVPLAPTTWGALQVVYPNGSSEKIVPVLDGTGVPTGAFNVPHGAPYIVVGEKSSTTGLWTSLTFKQSGNIKDVYTMPSGDTVYRLKSQYSPNGSRVNLQYSNRKLVSIDNTPDSGTGGTTLLSLTYNGNGYLDRVTENVIGTYRQFGYTNNLLTTVSQIGNTANEWTLEYETIGDAPYLKKVTTPDPSNQAKSAQIEYEANTGRVSRRVEANGVVRKTLYPTPGTGRVEVLDAEGTISNSYSVVSDAAGRRISVTHTNGGTTSWRYSSIDPSLIELTTLPNGGQVAVTADSHGNPTSVKYPYGNKTVFTWEYPTEAPFGRLVTSMHVGTDGSTYGEVTRTYYNGQNGPANFLHTVSTPDGALASYTYTAMGNLLRINTPYPTTFNYSPAQGTGPEMFGRPYSVTSPVGDTTHYQYDSAGRLSGVTDPIGRQVAATYNNYGQVTNITYPGGYSEQVTYTVAGKLPISSTLFSAGNAVSTTSANYDEESRLKQAIDALQNVRAFTLDGDGGLAKLTNENGVAMHQTSVAPNLQSATLKIGAGSSAIQSSAVADAMGNITSYTGSDGRSGSIFRWPTEPSLIATSTATDSHTNLTTHSEITRDSFGRPVDIWQYAADGKSAVWNSYTYDRSGRVSSETISDWFIAANGTKQVSLAPRSTHYFYNPDGTRSRMFVDVGAPSGDDTVHWVCYQYGYDAAQRVRSVEAFFTQYVANVPLYNPVVYAYYKYNPMGQVTEVRTPKATTLYTYNAFSQISEVKNLTPDGFHDTTAPSSMIYVEPDTNVIHSVLSWFKDITYDLRGNRTGMNFVALTQPGSYPSAVAQYASGSAQWTYDAVGQVTSEAWSDGLQSVSYTHSYDPTGNLTTLRNVGITTNPNSGRITGSGLSGYSSPTYTDSGEMAQFRGISLGYDPLGQVGSATGQVYSSATQSQVPFSHSMTYDFIGRRSTVVKQSGTGPQAMSAVRSRRNPFVSQMSTPGASEAIYYQYDGDLLISRRMSPSAIPNAATRSDIGFNSHGILYLWGPTGLVMEFNTYTSRTFLFDPQGNCVSASNGGRPNPDFAHTPEYPVFFDAYGALVWTPPAPLPGAQGVINRATSQPIQYKGQAGYFTDGETNLNYCLHRYYDPISGRWTSMDPSGIEGGPNLYQYADGDPVGKMDRDGNQAGSNPMGLQDIWSLWRRYIVHEQGGYFDSEYKEGYERAAMTRGFGGITGIAFRFVRHLEKGQYEEAALDVAELALELPIGGGAGRVARASRVTSVTFSTGETFIIKGSNVIYAESRAAFRPASQAGNLTEIMVIGKYPKYLKDATKIGAKSFSMPNEVYEKLTSQGLSWAANVKSMDRAINRRAIFMLSHKYGTKEAQSGFMGREIKYLENKGYKKTADGWFMVPPGKG